MEARLLSTVHGALPIQLLNAVTVAAHSWPTAGAHLGKSARPAGVQMGPQLAHSGQTADVQLARSWRTAGRVRLSPLQASRVIDTQQLGVRAAFQLVLSLGFRRFAWCFQEGSRLVSGAVTVSSLVHRLHCAIFRPVSTWCSLQLGVQAGVVAWLQAHR